VTNGDFYSTKPGTLAGSFLRRFWQPVARAHDIGIGRARTLRIMSEEIAVYRGESGRVYAVQARCPHRATQLSTGWIEDDTIRCRYHGWKFDERGQCVEQPGEDAGFAAKICLRSYPAQEYLDLVFVYFGEGDPPPVHRFPDFEGPGVVEASAPVEHWPCNYFNRIDNATDVLHLHYTHRATLSRSPDFAWRLTPSTIEVEETGYGIRVAERRLERPVSYSHFHMPNVNQVRARSRLVRPNGETIPLLGDRLFFRVPVDDEHSISFSVEYFALAGDDKDAYVAARPQRLNQRVDDLATHAAGIVRGDERIEDLDPKYSVYQMFWMEDYTVQVAQQPISDERVEHLGRNDVGVILLRKLWRRELQALAEGRPLTDWVTPPGLSGGEE
jgi:5,5'-dehydrodivanillate O-demethylase